MPFNFLRRKKKDQAPARTPTKGPQMSRRDFGRTSATGVIALPLIIRDLFGGRGKKGSGEIRDPFAHKRGKGRRIKTAINPLTYFNRYAAHKKGIEKFVVENRHEIFKKAKESGTEWGGYMFRELKTGKIRSKWLEDKEDQILIRSLEQLKGAIKKRKYDDINLRDLENTVRILKEHEGDVVDFGSMSGEFEAFRSWLEARERGEEWTKIREAHEHYEVVLPEMIEDLEKEAKLGYYAKAKEEAEAAERKGGIEVLCTFHTHPNEKFLPWLKPTQKVGISWEDMESSRSIPEAVFKFNDRNMLVNFLVNGKVDHEFSVPYK